MPKESVKGNILYSFETSKLLRDDLCVSVFESGREEIRNARTIKNPFGEISRRSVKTEMLPSVEHVEGASGRHLASGRWRAERFLAATSAARSVDTRASLGVHRVVLFSSESYLLLASPSPGRRVQERGTHARYSTCSPRVLNSGNRWGGTWVRLWIDSSSCCLRFFVYTRPTAVMCDECERLALHEAR